MSVRQQMNASMAEVIADRFRLLAEPIRIRILDSLREGSLTVGELAREVSTSQQNVSKHLGLLHRAGLLRREKDGNSVRYGIADESVFALCDEVCGGIQRHLNELRSTMEEGVTR